MFLYFYWRSWSLLLFVFLLSYFQCRFFAVKLSIIPVCSRMKFTSVKRVDISNTKQCWQPRHRKDRLSDLWVTVAHSLYAVFYSHCTRIDISRFTDEREPVQSGKVFPYHRSFTLSTGSIGLSKHPQRSNGGQLHEVAGSSDGNITWSLQREVRIHTPQNNDFT